MKKTFRISALIFTTMLILAFSSCAPANEHSPEIPSGNIGFSVSNLKSDKAKLDDAKTENKKSESAPKTEAEQEPKQEPQVQTPSADNTSPKLLTKDEALNIALSHAKLDKSNVRDIDIELDYENGIKVWEVDFESGSMEYSYEINASTGVIIESEKESD